MNKFEQFIEWLRQHPPGKRFGFGAKSAHVVWALETNPHLSYDDFDAMCETNDWLYESANEDGFEWWKLPRTDPRRHFPDFSNRWSHCGANAANAAMAIIMASVVIGEMSDDGQGYRDAMQTAIREDE